MLTIYSSHITERLTYVLSILFDDRGIEWQVMDDVKKFDAASEPKFDYSSTSSSLLYESTLAPQTIEKATWREIEILSFGGVPDVFASIFFVLSLYDDYLQTERDIHGRNYGKNSLLYQFGWLEQLKIEAWSLEIIAFIEEENNCSLKAKKIPFKVLPTFDIDHAFAYKYRKSWRKWLSIGRDRIKGDKKRIDERKQVLSGKKKDPFDTFEIIEEIAKEGFEVKVFWLLGDYNSFDKNINFKNKEQHALIQKVNTFAHVGLHPSYQSNTLENQLVIEKERLEKILETEVFHSRQHFLKISLPNTFEKLEKAGFTDDYSLGYADEIGFRAGIARPFLWFNLKENKISKLKLHPITYMDGTLNEYRKLSIEEAKVKVKQLKEEVQKYGGEFIPLWHNETIGDYGIWRGWKEVLAYSIH